MYETTIDYVFSTWNGSAGIAISAGIFEQSMGARNRVRIELSYRPARQHRLLESILGLHKCLKIPPYSQDPDRQRFV
jgi:hypothetical protein